MVLAARERGVVRVFVPEPQVDEAVLAGGLEVVGMRSLRQVVAELCGDEVPQAPPVAPMSGSRLLAWRGRERLDAVDLADVRGMPDARFAAEVAAAGGHHLLLSGPKGSGKTTLAERIPGLLPDLTREEAVELTALHSLAGALEPGDELLVRPPYAAPHHDASKAALVGGGSGQVRPGEISRAHCGVLFMDEFPLFRTDVIDALREPLESGDITIARAEESVTLPARSLVVLAANPCPCGNFAVSAAKSRCTCAETQRRSYQSRVRGPITDRIDITRHLVPLTAGQLDPLARPESTAVVRSRVQAARLRQEDRYAGQGWRLNGQAPGPALRDRWPLVAQAQTKLDQQMFGGRLTQRGAVRVHRIAWTLADLAGVEQPGLAEVDTAMRLRAGEPLLAEIGRAAWRVTVYGPG
jgi:magnesium chelatase family protein